ncbi:MULTISPECIES: FliH/SctL family protein [Thermotoga]|jgi:flagellar biosynthesis/type III secretory pathway protein FliH|uniref:FliH/SctL family protein n=1 Tax=Thermotoga TaxID=2335 RepID=UPI000506F453|nr:MULTISPECIES: FliH/SctL family protein [Thermotoga]AJG40590.1 flagellar export protein FliJ [Thermotoga sp. RQ7]KFZ22279.1 Flagellar export/assembly protein [Thermotoga neapolitana LA10]HBF11074.1 flagellar export protein FliJ [Thermotoga neapolitana]
MLLRKDEIFYIDLPKKIKTEEKESKESREVKEDPRKQFNRIKEQIISQAREEARKIVEEAEKRAEEILKSASEEAERLKLEVERLLEEKRKEKQKFSEYILSLKKQIQMQIHQKLEEILPDIVEVLRVLFRKILEKEMDESVVVRKLRSALSKVAGIENVKIKIHPEDLDKVDLKELKGKQVIPDPNVEKGGVILETEYGVLDKTFSYQWKLVEDIFEEVVGFERPSQRIEEKAD